MPIYLLNFFNDTFYINLIILIKMGELIVTITTWDKPNYELFDGESQNYRIQEYLINEPGIFCRNGVNETFFDQNICKKDGVRTLFNVRIDDGSIWPLHCRIIRNWR